MKTHIDGVDRIVPELAFFPFSSEVYMGKKTKRKRTIYWKSRIFRMHVIFVYFVHGGFRTKIKCMRKVQSKSENPQRSATVQKSHAYERLESPGSPKGEHKIECVRNILDLQQKDKA